MTQGKCCIICKIVGLLTAIGALNWGLLALFQLDLVTKVFGGMTTASKVVYIVIGVCGLITLAKTFGFKCPCEKGSCATK